ncbi:MAG: hypothetical protein HDR53_04155 [Treponema sp.]|nr:hypothetical protein [Treponema sp.]
MRKAERCEVAKLGKQGFALRPEVEQLKIKKQCIFRHCNWKNVFPSFQNSNFVSILTFVTRKNHSRRRREKGKIALIVVAAPAAKHNPCHNERKMRKRMVFYNPLVSFGSVANKTEGESRAIKNRKTMYLPPL